MNVSLIVATYGAPEWQRLGDRAPARSRGQGEAETVRVHLEAGTLAEARNSGADMAAGDWLCFVDGDDELAPGYLAAMAQAWAEHRGPGEVVATESGPVPTRLPPLARPALLVPAVEHVNAHGAQLTRPEIPAWGRRLIEVNCAVIGTLVPRALFFEVGGFRELRSLEDWDLWVRCWTAGAELVPVVGAVYRATRRQGSRNDDQAVYGALRAELEHPFMVEEYRRQGWRTRSAR